MTTRARAALVAPALVALTLVATACGGLPPAQFASETPPDSGAWTSIAALPAWITQRPVCDTTFRLVVESKSNLRNIAATPENARRAAEFRMRGLLTPEVGADGATRAAAAGAAAVRVVERVSQDEVLTRRAVPGNTLSTVWSLCEVPEDAILAPLPAADRDRARAALRR